MLGGRNSAPRLGKDAAEITVGPAQHKSPLVLRRGAAQPIAVAIEHHGAVHVAALQRGAKAPLYYLACVIEENHTFFVSAAVERRRTETYDRTVRGLHLIVLHVQVHGRHVDLAFGKLQCLAHVRAAALVLQLLVRHDGAPAAIVIGAYYLVTFVINIPHMRVTPGLVRLREKILRQSVAPRRGTCVQIAFERWLLGAEAQIREYDSEVPSDHVACDGDARLLANRRSLEAPLPVAPNTCGHGGGKNHDDRKIDEDEAL